MMERRNETKNKGKEREKRTESIKKKDKRMTG